MSSQNTSDLVEAYLKKILKESNKIEIRRAEMTNLFNRVPSQINYVVNTCFTIQRGYAVESKRGGGGYIHIIEVRVSDNDQLLKRVNQLIGAALTEEDALTFIRTLYEEEVITKKEGNLTLTTLDKSILNGLGNHEDFLRAQMMRLFLERLGYEEE